MHSRSLQKELLDDPNTSWEEILLNMQELNTINTYLGGHAITLKGMRKLVSENSTKNPLRILEIGCGGGDNLKAINTWAKKCNQPVEFTGLDLNPACIQYAQTAFPTASYIVSDYRDMQFETHPDIIFSSLFCHHFSDDELAEQLNWMYQNSRVGFFINDLHRHWLAYKSIQVLTKTFSRSRLVKHDAPLSVKRGFTHSDWVSIFKQAGLPAPVIQWNWAFRWLIVVTKKQLNDGC